MFASPLLDVAMLSKRAVVSVNRGSTAGTRRVTALRPLRASAHSDKSPAASSGADKHRRFNPVFTYRPNRRQRAIMDVTEIDSAEELDKASRQKPGIDKIKWAKRLQELASFYENKGHSTPPSGTSLSNWVKKMRTMRRRNELSQDMILALNALDLDWEPSQTRAFKRLEELQAFKQREGHIQVPTGCSLERWLRRMRLLKRNGKLERHVSIGLEKLGVVWEPATAKQIETDTIFVTRLSELKAIVAADGRVRKTNQYDPGMRTWLVYQQRCFREGKLSKGKNSGVERRRYTAQDDATRLVGRRLMELIEFKRIHGHCNVPATWRHNKELGSWVGTQRKYKRGSKLSEERIAALTSIGFEWEPKTALARGTHTKASPWTIKANSLRRGDRPQVQIDWIGGDDKRPPSIETFEWGRASANYEEKQQLVFSGIEKWWQEDASETSRRSIRGMRLNHRLNVGKKINFKPDILLEISSATPEEGALTWGLIVEVDEFGHRRGSRSYVNEESRMADLQNALGVPIKFVRFNPDPTEEDSRELEERTLELLEHLEKAVAKPPIRDLEVSYLAYD